MGKIMIKQDPFVDVIFTKDYGKYKKGKIIKTTRKWLAFYTDLKVVEQIFPFESEAQIMKRLLNNKEEE